MPNRFQNSKINLRYTRTHEEVLRDRIEKVCGERERESVCDRVCIKQLVLFCLILQMGQKVQEFLADCQLLTFAFIRVLTKAV